MRLRSRTRRIGASIPGRLYSRISFALSLHVLVRLRPLSLVAPGPPFRFRLGVQQIFLSAPDIPRSNATESEIE